MASKKIFLLGSIFVLTILIFLCLPFGISSLFSGSVFGNNRHIIYNKSLCTSQSSDCQVINKICNCFGVTLSNCGYDNQCYGIEWACHEETITITGIPIPPPCVR